MATKPRRETVDGGPTSANTAPGVTCACARSTNIEHGAAGTRRRSSTRCPSPARQTSAGQSSKRRRAGRSGNPRNGGRTSRSSTRRSYARVRARIDRAPATDPAAFSQCDEPRRRLQHRTRRRLSGRCAHHAPSPPQVLGNSRAARPAPGGWACWSRCVWPGSCSGGVSWPTWSSHSRKSQRLLKGLGGHAGRPIPPRHSPVSGPTESAPQPASHSSNPLISVDRIGYGRGWVGRSNVDCHSATGMSARRGSGGGSPRNRTLSAADRDRAPNRREGRA